MGIVARGGVVSRGGVLLYLGVDFAGGTAGELVSPAGIRGERVYAVTDDDRAAKDWVEYVLEE